MLVFGIVAVTLSLVGLFYLYFVDLPNYLDWRRDLDRKVESFIREVEGWIKQ